MRAAALDLGSRRIRDEISAMEVMGVNPLHRLVLPRLVAATVVAINALLAQAPELINQDPYGRGWILRLKPTAQGIDAGLLSAHDYQVLAAG